MAVALARQRAREFDETYRGDPCAWAEDMLGVHLWSKQREVLGAVFSNRRTIVRSGHQVGKSYISAVAALAFLYLHPMSRVITTAPTWGQVEDVIWREIRTLYHAGLAPFGADSQCLTSRLEIDTDWLAAGISSDKPDRIQGRHARSMLVILDEAPGIARPLWDALKSLGGNRHAHILAIGNPVEASGQFFDSYRDGSWHTIAISCLDSPNFTGEPVPDELREKLVGPEFVEDAKRDWGEDSPIFCSRVLGDFPVESEDTLIPLKWAEDAVARAPNPLRHLVKGLGADIARFGSDKTALIMLAGDDATILDVASKQDEMVTAGKILNAAKTHGFAGKIAVDNSGGYGSGVIDRLGEQGLRCIPVMFGAGAIESDRFVNRRTELWWNLREWIRDRGCIPDDGNLVADLTAPKYTYNSRGQIVLEKKESTKKRLGRSPDYGDALALALAAVYERPSGAFDPIDWGAATPITAMGNLPS